MAHIVTSVSRIREGDFVRAVVGARPTDDGRKVQKISMADNCTPECVHINHECFDMRFTTFLRVE